LIFLFLLYFYIFILHKKETSFFFLSSVKTQLVLRAKSKQKAEGGRAHQANKPLAHAAARCTYL